MFWLCAYFPYLSIEAINRSSPHFNLGENNKAFIESEQDTFPLLASLPLAISDGPEQRQVVCAINRAAFDCGIRIDMTLASAKVLHHDLVVLSRDTVRELRALKRIASFLLQFTPSVAIETDTDRAEIALEISASLTLFGGFDALLARVHQGMRAMRYVARYGAAPTPLAASLLARTSKRSNDVRICASAEALHDTLASISVKHFAWPQETFRSLDTLGLTTVGDVMRQPYAGLRKRFSDSLVHDLDRALGRANDVRRFYELPDTFASQIDFCFEIKDSARLLIPIGELLNELEDFLRARGAGTDEIKIELKQGRSRAQQFEFRSRSALRHAQHWHRLVRDRLETHELMEPVIEIALRTHRIIPLIEESESLLPNEKGTRSDWIALLDRLSSKVGEKNVYRVVVNDDHRPELAWRSESDESERAKQFRLGKIRPTWLLREPKSLIEMQGRPQYNGELILLAGPERIDTGWWDNSPVARDYFVASNPLHEVCWIFRDYRQGKRWYLHGFFS
ncbi:MAG: DNA polymerase Y family protein [Burkholderiales bacterium]|nr:MAG: DNA polymerase Y family protein [Burkholderiales bacterium]